MRVVIKIVENLSKTEFRTTSTFCLYGTTDGGLNSLCITFLLLDKRNSKGII